VQPLTALVAVAFLAISGSGCATGADDSVTSAAADVPSMQVALRGGQWVLAPGGSVEPGDDAALTLRVEEGTVSGSAGCNSYRGPIEVVGNRVTVGKLATTLRACEDAVMRVEDEFPQGARGGRHGRGIRRTARAQ
jgi:heat shock protein HslJ